MMIAEDDKKIIFIVIPLNLLGKQNIQMLERAEISAVAVSHDNANAQTVKVSFDPDQ